MSEPESIFPPEMAKHNLTFDFMSAGADFKALFDKVMEIQGHIESAKASKDESVKASTHPYDIGAKADKKAADIAAALINEFIDKCDVAMGKNKNLAYHLADMDNAISTYFTGEMHYQRIRNAPDKPATSTSKLEELYEDRKALVELGRMLERMIGSQLNRIDDLPLKDGAVIWPNLQGAKTGAKSETPTGRYAKHLQAQWTVDDKTFPIGTDIREIFREVFIGMQRNDRKLGDLIDPIDKARKASTDQNAKVTVVINKHTVTYEHVEI